MRNNIHHILAADLLYLPTFTQMIDVWHDLIDSLHEMAFFLRVI